jgi:hypothetical protein
MTGERYYRYDDSPYVDAGPRLSEYVLVRKTPKGAWIVAAWTARHYGVARLAEHPAEELRREHGARFVLDGKGRRFAYPDLADAKESYRIRKVRQIQHCRYQITKAEQGLAWCSGKLESTVNPQLITFD